MESTFFPYIAAFIWLGFFCTLGVFLRAKIKFFYVNLVPSSMIAAVLGFIAINLGIVGIPTTKGWIPISHSVFGIITFHLFAFSFASIGLMKNETGINKKVIARGSLWIMLICGVVWSAQALTGKGIFEIYKFIFGGNFSTDLGYLVGSGFTQGPGQVQAIAMVWEKDYNIVNSVSIGLTFAAIGFFVAVCVGIPIAKFGLKHGWTEKKYSGSISDDILNGIMKKNCKIPCANATVHPANIDNFAFHLSIMLIIYGISYFFAVTWETYMPGVVKSLGFGLLFTWCMFIAFCCKILFVKIDIYYLIDNPTLRRFSGSCVDFMVCAAFMAINVVALKDVIIPLIITSIIATIITYYIIFWFARRCPEYGFERGLVCFGTDTGTITTGMLLLRLVDPEFESPIAIEIGLQSLLVMLLMQPFYIAYPLIHMDGFHVSFIFIAYGIIFSIMFFILKMVSKPKW